MALYQGTMVCAIFVVYFDQQTGAPHAIRWSKSNILYQKTNGEVYPLEFGLGNGGKIINLLLKSNTY